eukprot:Pgem_evm1s5971
MGVDKIAFTGSTKVGKMIQKYSADSNLKRVTLELGGKSPMIICEDADLAQAVEVAHIGLFMNHGQCCCAGSRTYVHESVYDEFVKKVVAKTKSMKVGSMFCPDTVQGPQVDDIQFNTVMDYINKGKKEGFMAFYNFNILSCNLRKITFHNIDILIDTDTDTDTDNNNKGKAAGATCLAGGNRVGEKGYFIEPTVFTDVTEDMAIAQEEIFGPVMSIMKFKSVDEIIERANRTHYGLAAGICVKDIGVAIKMAKSIRAGTVWINSYNNFDAAAPFGGYKQSGSGRELGSYALDNYTE